ncbi:hypothetical protein IGI04_019598 [Brassica rapa subsp. trilocularis]|uniref:Alpha-galactosidase n=1 Tax=Brassica rapa subsp. trilocularis TaxID=1813537 RepID=A0ABQ7MJN3_BRACM|nr:hypothetical protein IGI04_019598 [Brassica rapa subsp. trilocularis]
MDKEKEYNTYYKIMEESKRPPCCSRAILMDWFSANRSIPFTILLCTVDCSSTMASLVLLKWDGIAGTSLLAISMKLSLRKLLMLWSPLAWLILGYIHVNIDDCWSNLLRDSKGKLVPHPETFPQGNKLLADYVHSKGLKLGIYSDAG